MAAHSAALAAGKQGRFFDYRYKLAPKFRQLNGSTYLRLAEEIGLDMEEFRKDMVLTPEVKEKINSDMRLGQQIGVRGTPTLFANGKKVKDRSFNGFVKLLKQYGG
jgi:protein-disulfide isomerase